MRRVELPGRAPSPYRRGVPLLTACLAAVVTVGMSSVRVPAVEPGRDAALLQVDRAWRAEFVPGGGRSGIRRSSIWRVTATLGRALPASSSWYLVVGPEAGAPDHVDTAAIEAAASATAHHADDEHRVADGEHPIADTPHRRPRGRRHLIGEPDWIDPGGWNAWRLRGPGPEARTLALSLEAAAVDTLGRWVGLFDASGYRVAVARLEEER